MSTDHMELRAAAAGPSQKAVITRANLVALLEEFDALRAAGQPKRKAAAKKAAAAPVGTLPGWLPLEAWEAFLAMRTKIKKPATDYAQKLQIKKLDAFRAQGLDVTEILEQSIVNGWQDLYAPKGHQQRSAAPGQSGSWPFPASSQGRLPRAQQQALATQEAMRRIDGMPAFDPNIIDMET
jgi:hypothetical protein